MWQDAIGASSKSKRLHLLDCNGFFHCPVESCDSFPYKSKRGCRKHVFQRHCWYYFFDTKPNVADVLPHEIIGKKAMKKAKRSNTVAMPSLTKETSVYKEFKQWLTSHGGGSKSSVQAEQISCQMLKFFKFSCQDISGDDSCDIPMSCVNYCI